MAEARAWFDKSAAQNWAAGQYDLGMIYYNGSGVTRSYEKAFEYLTQAANQNHAAAQYYLGTIYEYGYGDTDKNLDTAKSWYQKAADQGQKDAAAKLTQKKFQ